MFCLLCCCALLSGCQRKEDAAVAQATLPPAQIKAEAPGKDAEEAYEQTAMLYLPSPDGTRLVAAPAQVMAPADGQMAEALCRLLLAHPGMENAQPVGGGTALALASGRAVEVSGQVATVHLAASARELNQERFFILGQALANTVGQFGDIQYVNVLIGDAAPSLSAEETLPGGCFQPNTREDLSALWARASAPMERRTLTAALYYPAPSGKGILCEARNLAFPSGGPAAMAQALLEALSADPVSLPKTPSCPDFQFLLREPPSVEESEGKRVLNLLFRDTLNSALIDLGITRSVVIASLVYTLTTFLPDIDGVRVRIGEEEITSMTPSGVYNLAGKTVAFPGGVMRRADFEGFLLAECLLYFAGEDGSLIPVYRPVPCRDAARPRMLYQQLLLGSQAFDSQTNLQPILPEGLKKEDLLAVSYDGDVLLLNFSSRIRQLAQGMGREAENRLVYGLVNTFCALRNVKRVAFFVEGKQPESLGGEIYLPGDFLPGMEGAE